MTARRAIVALLSICVAATAARGIEAQTATDVRAAEAATAVVLARHGDSTWTALAVVVRGPQLVAMPLDVVLGAGSIRLRFGDGELVDVIGLVDLDDRRNLALMRARVVDRTPLVAVGEQPRAQTRVTVIAARDSTLVAATATLGALSVVEGVRSAPLGGELPPLHHGAPVVDASAALIGLVMRGSEGSARVVPVSAISALDAGRQLTPMSAVAQLRRPATAARDSAAGTAADSLPRQRLVSGLRALNEFELAHNLMVALALGTGFRNGPPRIAYELQPELAAAKTGLASIPESTAVFGSIARTTVRLIDALAASSNDYLQAVTQGRASGVWGPPSQALAQRSAASAGIYDDLLPILRDQLRAAVVADTVFRRMLGDEALLRWGVIPSTSSFRFGWYSLIRNPFRIIYQPADSFGYELGFRSLDIIIATGTEQWGANRTVDEFKVFLEARLGQVVIVDIERNGQRIQLPVRMPRRIPSKYTAAP